MNRRLIAMLASSVALSCLLSGNLNSLNIFKDRADDKLVAQVEGAFPQESLGSDLAEIAIDLRDGTGADEVIKFGQRHNLSLRYNSVYSVENSLLYTKVERGRVQSVLHELQKDPLVEAVEENFTIKLVEPDTREKSLNRDEVGEIFPNDPLYERQWNFSQINVPQAWSWGQGRGVTVAVVDTGIAWQNGDGRPAVEDLDEERIVPGYDFVNDNNLALDDNSHGTHVAGTIGQATHNGLGLTGIAHRAKLMPVKVLSSEGEGSILDIADGIRFAADHGANIINMSLGGPSDSHILHNAVRYAHKRGVLVVCAAGNEGSYKPSYPAAYPESLSVSAVNNQGYLSYYSNRGNTVDIAAPGGELRRDMSQEDLWANGICQNTLNPFDTSEQGYYTFQGTSMASPHVAGVAALLAGQGVNNPKMMKKILQKTAQKINDRENTKKIDGYGAGVVDAEKVCRYASLSIGMSRLVVALAAIGVFFELFKKKCNATSLTVVGLTTLFSGCGLFFMPLLCPTYCVDLGPWMYGIPAWDMFIFGARGHGSLLFYSALIPGLMLWAVDKFNFSDLTKMCICGVGFGFVSNFICENMLHSVNLAIVPSSLRSIWLVANSVIIMLLVFRVLDKSEDEL